MTKGKLLTPKERILKERGLSQTQPAPHKHKRILPEIRPVTSGKPKTALMRYLEEKYHCSIESVLLSGSLSIVAKKLGGEVDVTTLSKWIKRFQLRYSKDNLPQCQGCQHYGVACTVGICYILVRMELWELVEIKKEELLNG